MVNSWLRPALELDELQALVAELRAQGRGPGGASEAELEEPQQAAILRRAALAAIAEPETVPAQA